MDRRAQRRLKKNYALSENVVVLIQAGAAKYGLSEAGVISTAIVQWADREGISIPKQEQSS